ncbi:hypothetical protein sos41_21940 [Alphaproteobacteria bacterium SO-S41]|nr:hypothetical protein sos41_21940 [Alphaproteobacteria bacterium SO-S41]
MIATRISRTLCVAALALSGAAQAFDTKPWLEDLAQARQAFGATYANFEWAVFEREADLSALFDETKTRIEAALNEADAKAAFYRLARRLGDGHVVFDWPAAQAVGSESPAADRCASFGYRADILGTPLAAEAPGYTALETPQSAMFPAGLIVVDGRTVGVVKIGLFSPSGFPELCAAGLKALNIAPEAECDDACRFRLDDWASAEMTVALAAQLRAVKASGATALVVDLADNGGGSEWAEAAARMVTAKRLESERMGFVRGAHWVTKFASHEADIRSYAAEASGPADKAFLTKLADELAAKGKVAATPCDSAPFWKGAKPECAWLGEGFYGSGFVASADPAALKDKPWASYVFSPMKYPYEEGVWDGPLIVLVDGGTASASEEFTAVLQDNGAAFVMGSPTAGAGCGHTDGGTPTVLKNSGATLEVPDCVRFRVDGSNEVMGIAPDRLVGFRTTDGPKRLGQRFMEKLPEALAAADALFARR